MMRIVLALLIVLATGAFGLEPVLGAPASGQVVALTLVGPINPVAASYLNRGVHEAEAGQARAVVIRLDTPGGLDSAMRDIIQQIVSARVPVIVYVSPRGGRAASAGMYITIAAHVAAMAPDTAIGAAHPVAGGGSDIPGAMGQKVTNDAAAYARGLAAARGRNAVWVESAVRRSVSLSAAEALKRHVIDRVAPDTEALLASIDGMTVQVGTAKTVLHTRGVAIAERPMGDAERLLYAMGNPELALILLNLGTLGIIFELQNPSGLLAGIAGVVCLLLGLFALGSLPVDGAGVALMLFGLFLFVLELWIPSYGLLSVGGVTALILGGLMLFHSTAPGLAPGLAAIIGLPLALGAVIFTGAWFAAKARRRPVAVGVERLIGQEAVVRSPLGPSGMVFLEGELWRAESSEAASIAPGDRVVVDRVEGLTLHVHRKAPAVGT